MYTFMFVLHILITIALIGVILVQRGRSGGLVEALGGVESIFGTKTSSFFVKVTVGLAITFFLSSISLAYLSRKRGSSLMEKYAKPVNATQTVNTTASAATAAVSAKPVDTAVSKPADQAVAVASVAAEAKPEPAVAPQSVPVSSPETKK